MSYTLIGTSAFRKTNVALFAAGFNTFSILYCTQAILPEFSREFGISPAFASLSLSLTTITLAVSMLFLGSLSEVWGRKKLMGLSLIFASLLCIMTAFSSTFETLLVFRVIQGIVLAGLPSVAMAYLGEEIEPGSLGKAMGIYISGNAFGGVAGRLMTGVLTEYFNWSVALDVVSVISLLATFVFFMNLPDSQNFTSRSFELRQLTGSLRSHLQDKGMLCLFAIGFALLGSNVALYNYIGYALSAPPYSWNHTLVSFIFVIFFVGVFSSVWMGTLADRYGRKKVLLCTIAVTLIGSIVTLHPVLWIKITGLLLLTFGFFGSHSIASSWVGRRATHDKAQASSLYLFFYYAGSSIGGTVAGLCWSAYGWKGVIALIGVFLTTAFFLAVRLSKMPAQQTHVH
ncbi:MFS transporter [Priestia megaterium]|uniref:MFS transporter n=1 Tax=Priestia megaterium TaxID=1404 RepID=UPI00119E7DA8|nr:MFS transporter [Priestia megaterium]MCM3018427.1 MFS transporter [Priestia megaterium]